METPPHDRFARRAFADLDVMRAHLRAFLPPDVAARLDLARLRREPDVHLDPELRERLSDLIFFVPTVDGGAALVWFLFEHKSTPDRFLPFDLLRSATRILESWRREHPDDGELPQIVPVVLYAGPRPFTAPRRLTALCGDDSGLGPDIGYVLTDLSKVGDDVIRDRVGDVAFAALAHLLLKHARSDDLFERLARWADFLSTILAAPTALDALRTVLTYLFAARGPDAERDLAAVVLPRLDEHERETVMSTFKSYADVLREEGSETGRRREAAEVLLRQIDRRFDGARPTDRERIEAAPLDVLHVWLDRVLDAPDLDALFAD